MEVMIFWMRVLAVWTDTVATSSYDSKNRMLGTNSHRFLPWTYGSPGFLIYRIEYVKISIIVMTFTITQTSHHSFGYF